MLDGLAPDDHFGAIVRSHKLMGVMHRCLTAGGFIVAALVDHLLVGYATTVPVAMLSSPEAIALDRWHDLPDAFELGALEVAARWRRRGLATAILARWASIRELQRWIVLAHGNASHWDLYATGLSASAYRALLVRMLARSGFAVQRTDDPDACETPFNFLAVRVGETAPPVAVATMLDRLRLGKDTAR